MRFEFRENEGISSLLLHHGTDLEKFTHPAVQAIGESCPIARRLGRPYATVADLLLRLSMPDKKDEEQTRDIMANHGLTTESILSIVCDPTEEITTLTAATTELEKAKGIETNFRILLASLDYYQLIYPGLPRANDMSISRLDLLYNAVMWTKDSAALVINELKLNPRDLVSACFGQRLQNMALNAKTQEYRSRRSTSKLR
jgi:hypothetical protein